MNKILTTLLLTFVAFSFSSCSGDGFDSSKFKVEVNKTFQLHDKFSKNDLNVTYDSTALVEDDYTVDLTNFDSSKIGDCSISVSPVTKPSVKVNVPINITNHHECNILSIGDSFNFDTLYYVQEIANAKAQNDDSWKFNVYVAIDKNDYTIDKAYSDFLTGDKAYLIKKFNNETHSWVGEEYCSFQEILDFENIHWDFITIEQDACLAGQDSYSNLSNLTNSINRYLLDKNLSLPNILWNMPFAYSDNTQVNATYNQYYDNNQRKMFDAIIDKTKNNLSNSSIDKVMPTGTLIQNLRANELYNDAKISGSSENITTPEVKFAASILYVTYISGNGTSEFIEDIFDYETLKQLDIEKLNEVYKAINETIAKPFEISIIN